MRKLRREGIQLAPRQASLSLYAKHAGLNSQTAAVSKQIAIQAAISPPRLQMTKGTGSQIKRLSV